MDTSKNRWPKVATTEPKAAAESVSSILLGLLLVFVIFPPLNALTTSWTCREIWSWFLAATYGPGPSLAGWYGINLLMTLATLHLTREKWGITLAGRATKSFGLTALGCALILGVSYFVRIVCGWA
jgi:hypothetical protein